MKSIDEHIKKDQSELEAAKAEGNDAKVRHFSEELESLQDEVIDELDRLNLRIESLLATMVKQAPELEIDTKAA